VQQQPVVGADETSFAQGLQLSSGEGKPLSHHSGADTHNMSSKEGFPSPRYDFGNADKGNPDERTAWLWVAVTPLVTCFQVLLSRSLDRRKVC
jgi:hypothetical protein